MTSRRGRGEDSVYLDGERWRGAASLGYAPDGRRIRKKVSGATKAEVLRKLRDLRSEINAGMPIPDDRQTVAAFLDRWLTASLPGQVSEKTLDSYADTVRLHIKPSLGRKVLRKLTVSDVDQLLAWKRNAGYSANTVRIIRAVLRRALRQAEREELRHSGASLMLAQGTDLYVVSEVLGHSSVAITKDVYGHLVEGQKARSCHSDVPCVADAAQWLPRWLPKPTRTGRLMRAECGKEGID